MNENMVDILKDYLELCSMFTEKLEEIKANEVLNINLELVKASIIDLNINLSNFKDILAATTGTESAIDNHQVDARVDARRDQQPILQQRTDISNASNLSANDKKQLLAMFFMFLMKIDETSILNNRVLAEQDNRGGNIADGVNMIDSQSQMTISDLEVD